MGITEKPGIRGQGPVIQQNHVSMQGQGSKDYQKGKYQRLGKNSKHRFLSILLIAALLLALQPIPMAEAGGSTFQFAYHSREDICINLEGDTLTVVNLPDTATFRSVLVFVKDMDKQPYIEKRLNRSTSGSVSVSLSDLRDGDYYIEFYYSIGGDDFASYIYGDGMRFRWQNGVGVFWDPPALARNKRIFEAARKDNSALAHYLSPSFFVQSNDVAIARVANEITRGLTSDYEKAVAIHDWICKNMWYDSDVVSDSSKRTAPDALTTLNNRRGVCEGYANLYAALLRAVHIPAKIVLGFGLDSSMQNGWTEQRLSGTEMNHSWNEVYIDGRWVIMDATWNCGNEYKGGRQGQYGGVKFSRYLDATLRAFSIDHLIADYMEEDIPLPDNPSLWAAELVHTATDAGLVPQVLRVKYTQAITRAEFCALAVALYEKNAGGEITGRAAFVDSADINVLKMGALGVVTGVGDGYFSPDARLTREQAAVMLANLAVVMGKPLAKNQATFVDSSWISTWAQESVGQVQAAGIMGGMGNNVFAPRGAYTREQSIVTMFRLFEITMK